MLSAGGCFSFPLRTSALRLRPGHVFFTGRCRLFHAMPRGGIVLGMCSPSRGAPLLQVMKPSLHVVASSPSSDDTNSGTPERKNKRSGIFLPKSLKTFTGAGCAWPYPGWPGALYTPGKPGGVGMKRPAQPPKVPRTTLSRVQYGRPCPHEKTQLELQPRHIGINRPCAGTPSPGTEFLPRQQAL